MEFPNHRKISDILKMKIISDMREMSEREGVKEKDIPAKVRSPPSEVIIRSESLTNLEIKVKNVVSMF